MLCQEQSYLEMMQTGSCSSPPPAFSTSTSNNFDFNLDLLPPECQVPALDLPLPIFEPHTANTAATNNYCASVSSGYCSDYSSIPSPTASALSPLEASLNSPTMFSPVDTTKGGSKEQHGRGGYNPVSPYSPYSPQCRPQRHASTDSAHTTSSLQESLAEFNELQNKIRLEQEGVAHQSQAPPPYPKTSEANTEATVQIKIEPMENPLVSADPNLRRYADTTKSFDLGVSTGQPFGHSSLMQGPPPAYPGALKQEEVDPKTEQQDVNVKMEPVLSLAMAQVKRDISIACRTLNISPNPLAWSSHDIRNWLMFTMQEYNIDATSPGRMATLEHWAKLGGAGFAQLSEDEFKEQFQQDGELLHAKLDIWRSAANFPAGDDKKDDSFDINYVLSMLESRECLQQQAGPPASAATTTVTASASTSTSTSSLYDQPPSGSGSAPAPAPSTASRRSMSSETDFEAMDDADEDDDSSPNSGDAPTASTSASTSTSSGGRSSANIHLWQFVKELLNQPHLYSGCIHWIDRERGIFKIVDSNRVATLWGKRKNRPAMNYDKLSRSLRQYYKKGIMKKTERTQRLVYQFCSPYHL